LVNNKLQGHILEIVDNQMRENEPKCTKEVFEKLVGSGYAESIAKKMIGAILVEELYYVLKNEELFNEERYSNKLSKLPEYNDKTGQVKAINENNIGRNSLCSCGSGKKYKKCCGK
jgi:preprotein translocase subunit SecA